MSELIEKKVEKKVEKQPKQYSDSLDIFSREDVIDWKKLEETLKDLSFKDIKNHY